MKNKLWFLTKMSLNKKIKTKWFLIANIFFFILIIGLVNIDIIIKFFGGDFNETGEILVIDNAGVFDEFKEGYLKNSKYVKEYRETDITLYDKSYDEGIKIIEKEKHKLLLVIDEDIDNYLKATVVSKEAMSTINTTLISTTLSSVRTEIVLAKYDITREEFNNIQKNVDIETISLSDNSLEENLIIALVMQVIILPVFMLIMFLVQMIGAEVNEEKTTKSMEIIISNVSPRTHFMSKVIAANAFVFIQGFLLIVFSIMAVVIRLITIGIPIDIGDIDGVKNIVNNLPININVDNLANVLSTLHVMIPVLILMLILTFMAYSLFAGILASMTTNLEDFQQLQTPIMIVSIIGYYLSVMAGMFKGSIFIKIMSYIPFISSLLAPTLYVMGEINVFDLIFSILLLVGTNYILIKYGLRIYKVGILNYSGNGLWKKMFKAVKEK